MRAGKPVRVRTAGVVAIERAGWRVAYQGLSFCVDWWITSASLERSPETVDEFADWWKISRSQGFRRQLSFRKCFPEFESPTELAEVVGFDFSQLKKRDEARTIVELQGWVLP